MTHVLRELYSVIAQRKSTDNPDSYTVKLLEKTRLVERKVHEECYEVLEASFEGDHQQLIYESADLIYHLLVLLAKHDISLESVEQELLRRRN